MSDHVNAAALHSAVDSLATAVQAISAQAGDVPAVRRLLNDVERIKIDAADCGSLQPIEAPRQLEIIPDTPYDEAMWKDVDDEGLGGFHRPDPRRPHGHRQQGRR
jgi:hypothetical protein